MEDDKLKSLLAGLTCLIIDDDKFSRTFIKTALNQIGIRNVVEALDDKEARTAIDGGKIDVVLLDQLMPVKTGLDFAKELKAVAETKDLPIIMITVDAKEQTVVQAKEIGINEYLVKPVSPLALKKRILSVIGKEAE